MPEKYEALASELIEAGYTVELPNWHEDMMSEGVDVLGVEVAA